MTVTEQTDSDFIEAPEVGSEPTVETTDSTDSAPQEETSQEAVDRLDLEQYANHRVTVKVGGEEVEMPLSEALAGTMRHADYTRKTQELAAQRERLAELERLEHWLETDPAGTIKALQASLGITDTDDEEIDPVEARIRAIEQEREQEREQARTQVVIAEATQAISSFNLDGVRPEDLLQYALDNRVGDLKVAARLYKIEQAEVVKRTELDKTIASKRAASVVEGGQSTGPSAVVPTHPKKMSIREAYQAALESTSR